MHQLAFLPWWHGRLLLLLLTAATAVVAAATAAAAHHVLNARGGVPKQKFSITSEWEGKRTGKHTSRIPLRR